MRLFKRRCSDPSPQLVSATPISQDRIPAVIEAPEERGEESTELPLPDECTSRRKSDTEVLSDNGNLQPTCPESSYSTRKGISTWGRKVGRKWDQLKRSDSSELLAVSGRRRRHWSPNRKENGEVIPDDKRKATARGILPTTDFAKPKRVSRVESLKNLFRSGDRSASCANLDVVSRSATICEEDVATISDRYRMDKALSEPSCSTLTSSRMTISMGEESSNTEISKDRDTLRGKKSQLSRSIQNLQEQQRLLDFILTNQEILKTREGVDLAKHTLECSDQSGGIRRLSSLIDDSSADASPPQSQPRRQLSSVKRNLFNPSVNSSKDCHESAGSASSSSSNSAASSAFGPLHGLEELMSGLRVGCDESGYDSDSTRTGADSPDSGKSVPTMQRCTTSEAPRPRSLSITSDDYHAIDLTAIASTPKKASSGAECGSRMNREDRLNASVTTESTVLTYDEEEEDDDDDHEDDGDDTDSCDEETFVMLTSSEDTLRRRRSCEESANVSRTLSKTSSKSSGLGSSFHSDGSPDLRDHVSPTRRNLKIEEPVPLGQLVRLQNHRVDVKNDWTGKKRLAMKHLAYSDETLQHLLENAASPCRDSPPASKGRAVDDGSSAQMLLYYSPKRSRSGLEKEENTAKRQVHPREVTAPTSVLPSKTLVRRELKTMKLIVDLPGGLGIVVERREAARPFYIVSKVDADGEAGKSGQIRVGDEIVRVCGRRLRGMSVAEARTALRSCSGTVELQIAREPSFAFGQLGDTWGEVPVPRTRSESEVWKLKGPPAIDPGQTVADGSVDATERDPEEAAAAATAAAAAAAAASCHVVGALTKDGKRIGVTAMDDATTSEEREPEDSRRLDDDAEKKLTGMKKFQVVRKRNSTTPATPYARRATSLSVNLLTVILRKGSSKKLGFSIVGGSDSTKGSMGIFVKDVMNGGQASEEGTLRVGDEILAINGTPMNGLTHAKALQAFKAAKPGDLILHVGRRDPAHNKRYAVQSKSCDALDKLTECCEGDPSQETFE